MVDERDHERLKKLNEELLQAKQRLEALSHFKTHLLSLTSHEVRTSLAAIRGYAALLREGGYGELGEKAREAVARIEFAAADLVNLVENIIDLRKLEEGRIEYEFVPLDFAELVGEVVEWMRPLAVAKKLELRFSAPPMPCVVRGDKRHLAHIVQNLIDNAVKYTPSGFVEVALREEDGIVLSVRDSGIGIPKGLSPLLFEEFVRDERVKHEIRGTGIGLHITKSVVEAHGGSIWCESEGEGKGSTFFVRLKKIKE